MKQITLSQLSVETVIVYNRVLDIEIENRENEHGRMTLLLELKEETSSTDVLALEQSVVTVKLPDGRVLFTGICEVTAYSEQAEYKTVGLEVYTYTLGADRLAKHQTYQNPTKTLADIVATTMTQYTNTYSISSNPTISKVVYQSGETDWQFIRRLANQSNQMLYADTRSVQMNFSIGTSGMNVYEADVLDRKLAEGKDITELRNVLMNADENAAAYQFTWEEYLCHVLTAIPGDMIGQDTVKSSYISNRGGILENRIRIAKSGEIRPEYADIQQMTAVSNIMIGEVQYVQGNTIQVKFDTDAGSMQGSYVDIPYESIISNSFYSMPDEGDKVVVYFEDKGEIVCIGSLRTSAEGTDFDTPQDKVLTSYDKMVRLASDALTMTATRALHDVGSDTEISIILNDADGITITSGKDIILETTDKKDIYLGANDLGRFTFEKLTYETRGKIDSGKKKFADSADQGSATLAAARSEVSAWDRMKQSAAIDFNNVKDDWDKSFESAFTFPNVREFVNDMQNGTVEFLKEKYLEQGYTEVQAQKFAEYENKNGAALVEDYIEEYFIDNPPIQEPEPEQYETGVLTIYGLNTVELSVGNNFIYIGADIYIHADVFNWLGYTKKEYETVTNDYSKQDWFGAALDGLQLALDVVGFFCPIADVVNAGISLLRGDFAGAAISLVAAIPLVGDAAKVAYKTVKAAKGVNTARKVVKGMFVANKVIKVTNLIYSNFMIFEQLAGFYVTEKKINLEDGFGADDLSGIFSILRGVAGITKQTKDNIETYNDSKKPSGNGGDDNNGTGDSNDSSSDSSSDSSNDSSDNTSNNAGDSPNSSGDTATDTASTTDASGSDGNDSIIDGPETSAEQSETISDPINVVTGSLSAEYVDLSLEDILGSFALKRRYESAWQNQGGMLGDKWRYEIETSIQVKGDSAVVQLPDLHLEKFHKIDGRWENLNKGFKAYVLQDTAEGYCFYKKSEQSRYNYDEAGKLISIIDAHGNRTTCSYEGVRLSRITLASGKWIAFQYNQGKVCEVRDNIGRKITYTYQDEFLHIAKLPNGGMMQYDYTKEGYIVRAYDLNGKFYAKNYYDRKGRVIRQELAGGEEYVAFYDDAAKQNTFVTTSDGNSMIYQYGIEKLPYKIIYPDKTTVEKKYDAFKNVVYEKDRRGNEIYRTYNADGQLVQERLPNGFVRSYEYDNNHLIRMYDNTGRESINEYDACGNLITKKIRISEKEFRVTRFTYDNNGRIVSRTDAEGNTTRFYYDSMANLVKKIRPNAYDVKTDDGDGISYEYDVWENLKKVIQPDGGVYSFENDFYGKRISEEGPEEYCSGTNGRRYEYDCNHNRIRAIYPDGAVLREFYDANGNLIKRILPEQYDKAKDDGIGYTYEYDSCNRLIQVTNPSGVVEHRYVYDLAGQLVKDIDAKGYLGASTDEERVGTVYTYNLTGDITQIRQPIVNQDGTVSYKLIMYRYDAFGNCIEEKRYMDYQTKDSCKGRMNSIRYQYDKENRLVRINDSLGACMEYAYNCRSQRTMEKRKIGADIWQERHYIYSPAGRVIRIMDSADENGCGRKYTPTYFSYDKSGNLTGIKTATGYEILREYDICDRMIAETHKDKSGNINHTVQYIYDKAGKLTQIWKQDGYRIFYSYDALGRVVQTKDSRGAIEQREYDLNGNLLRSKQTQETGKSRGYQYKYDEIGRNTYVLGLDGEVLHFNQYNDFGEKEQEGDEKGAVHYTYDYAGRRTAVRTNEGSSQEYEYDALGNIIALKDGNGNRTKYETDLWGRIIKTHKADGSIEAYTYDYAGNITVATDGNGNEVYYRYNSLNKLAARQDALGCEESFLYDMDGRLSEHVDREGKREIFRYNMYGAPLLHENIQSGLTETWEYDQMGYLKSAVGGGMRYEYIYTQGGLLKEKKASGRTLISYEYDAFGRKIAQTDLTGKTTEYSYDTYDRLVQVHENGRIMADYEYLSDGMLKQMKMGNSILTEYSYDADKNMTSMKTLMDGITILADIICIDMMEMVIALRNRH